jgi:hypothetical protein
MTQMAAADASLQFSFAVAKLNSSKTEVQV